MPSLLHRLIHLPERARRVTGNQAYIPQLDGLRFFAIMPVLFWHASIRGYRSMLNLFGMPPMGEPTWLPHGEVGVDLFFVISGFVIARPFLAMIEQGRSLKVGRFYLRRLLRLQPPYLLVLVVCAASAAFGLAGGGHNPGREVHRMIDPWASFWASFFYVHVPVFGVPSLLDPPIWSLEIEVQFYLLSPLLIWLYARMTCREWRLAAGIWAVTVAMIAGAAIRAGMGVFAPWSFTLATQLDGFLLGVLLADMRQWRLRPRPGAGAWKDAGFLLGLFLLLASGLWELLGAFWPMLLRDALRLLACALIVDGALGGTRAGRLAGAPWIALIGSACYSIYLIHVPLMVIVWIALTRVMHIPALWIIPSAMALLPIISIAAGLVFYALVERPFMSADWPAKFMRAFAPRLNRSEFSS